MAFRNVIFPSLKYVHGTRKSLASPVTITGNGVREIRRKQFRFDRLSWTFPARNITQQDKTAIYKFLRGVDMGMDSFLLQDPEMPELVNAQLTHKGGNVWYLNVPFDAATPGTHPIFNPQMGSLTFRVNGAVRTATFAIDAAGYPTVSVAGSTSSSTVTVSGPLYYTVRLNSELSWSLQAFDDNGAAMPTPVVSLLNDISFIEVFERA